MKLCYFNYEGTAGEVCITDLSKEDVKIFKHEGMPFAYTCKLTNLYGKKNIPERMRNDQLDRDFQHTYPNHLNTERSGYYWMITDVKNLEGVKKVFMSAVKAQINKEKAEVENRVNFLNSLYTKASMIESGEMNLDSAEYEEEEGN